MLALRIREKKATTPTHARTTMSIDEAETNRGTHNLGGVKKTTNEEEAPHVMKKLNTTMKS